MLDGGFAIVVDIGKTTSKITLLSRDGDLLDRQTRPNPAVEDQGIRRLDADGIGAWLIHALKRYAGRPVETIIPVGHGAAVAALRDEALAFAPFDYEQPLPPDLLADYRARRDSFAATGSPALPEGLNFGAQLYWQDRLFPEIMRDARLLPWPQYWAWFLSGGTASEVTSLGCHSDLWLPAEGRFSRLADEQGWTARFAPVKSAGEVVGLLRPEIADAIGLSRAVEVRVGLHDSNAALLAARGHAEIAAGEATILSTGTWFVAMRSAGRAVGLADLPDGRDCLVNVDIHGRAVLSSRFMGGREIELLIGGEAQQVDIAEDQAALLAAAPDVVRAGAMILPTLAPGCGPFPDGATAWVNRPAHCPASSIASRAAACLYAALVADQSLALIGTRERLLIEGRFADAELFARALAALRPDLTVLVAGAQADLAFGALRLVDPDLVPAGTLRRVAPLDTDLTDYRAAWQAAIASQ